LTEKSLDRDERTTRRWSSIRPRANSYLGSVRGARGTLWSLAGNSLDTASVGVTLIRASGIPAQYASGTLSQSNAQELILSKFPASYQTVGYIPAGTQVSDPANDPQLLSETEHRRTELSRSLDQLSLREHGAGGTVSERHRERPARSVSDLQPNTG
jgi:hypothetical protein